MSDADKKPLFLMYSTPQGGVKVEVVVKDETVWVTQKAMAELFGVEVPTINYHLKNIFADGELARESTVRKILIVQTEGGRLVERNIEYHNLDAIISVGYRVNSRQAAA